MNSLTISQAANFLAVSTKTLKRWELTGTVIPNRNQLNHRTYPISKLRLLKTSSSPNNPTKLTLKYIAAYCDLSPRTIIRWEDQGLLTINRNRHGQRVYNHKTLTNVLKLVDSKNQTSITTLKRLKNAYPSLILSSLFILILPLYYSTHLNPQQQISDLRLANKDLHHPQPSFTAKSTRVDPSLSITSLPDTSQYDLTQPSALNTSPIPTPHHDLVLAHNINLK